MSKEDPEKEDLGMQNPKKKDPGKQKTSEGAKDNTLSREALQKYHKQLDNYKHFHLSAKARKKWHSYNYNFSVKKETKQDGLFEESELIVYSGSGEEMKQERRSRSEEARREEIKAQPSFTYYFLNKKKSLNDTLSRTEKFSKKKVGYTAQHTWHKPHCPL